MIYAPEIIELYPWFADLSGSGSFSITSDQPYYGTFGTSSQNDSFTWKATLRPGSYTVSDLCTNGSDHGISSISNGGSTLGTLDKYAGSTSYGQTETATSLSLASGNIVATASTKNASSSGYVNPSTYTRLVRTGD